MLFWLMLLFISPSSLLFWTVGIIQQLRAVSPFLPLSQPFSISLATYVMLFKSGFLFSVLFCLWCLLFVFQTWSSRSSLFPIFSVVPPIQQVCFAPTRPRPCLITWWGLLGKVNHGLSGFGFILQLSGFCNLWSETGRLGTINLQLVKNELFVSLWFFKTSLYSNGAL